ncbi:hypothetical protein ACFQYP_07100 [Nonomuraea antimicrobica]
MARAHPGQIDKLATITPHATGATIKDLVNESLMTAVRAGREVVTWSDVLRARRLKQLGPPEAAEYIDRERHAVAVHEACHAVVAYATRRHLEIDVATIEKGADHLGLVASIKPEDRFTRWKSEHEADIMVSLASLAGERMFFGEDSSSGVSGDLYSATYLTALMESSWGMGVGVASLPALQELEIAGGGAVRGSASRATSRGCWRGPGGCWRSTAGRCSAWRTRWRRTGRSTMTTWWRSSAASAGRWSTGPCTRPRSCTGSWRTITGTRPGRTGSTARSVAICPGIRRPRRARHRSGRRRSGRHRAGRCRVGRCRSGWCRSRTAGPVCGPCTPCRPVSRHCRSRGPTGRTSSPGGPSRRPRLCRPSWSARPDPPRTPRRRDGTGPGAGVRAGSGWSSSACSGSWRCRSSPRWP